MRLHGKAAETHPRVALSESLLGESSRVILTRPEVSVELEITGGFDRGPSYNEVDRHDN